MNTYKRKQRLSKELQDKEYRDAFVIEHIDTGIPFQIRALREQRGLRQKDLEDCSGIAQETISRLEDPNYGKLTLTTLKRLASAFDVGLLVRFVPFSDLVEWELNLSPDSLKVLSFPKDPYFQEKEEDTSLTVDHERYPVRDTQEVSSKVVYLRDHLARRTNLSNGIPSTMAIQA
jgi:transcriptional regulator with XRE-family HTH domain